MNRGTHTYPDGTTCDGEWKDRKKHGHGIWTKPDGLTYIGEWENDKPHGQGTLTWPSGKKFVGQWINGKRHGPGVEILQDGTKRFGEWDNGKLLEKKFPSTANKKHTKNLETTKQTFSDVPDDNQKQKSDIKQRNNQHSPHLIEKQHFSDTEKKRHQQVQPGKRAIILPVFVVLFILTLGAVLFFLMGEDETSSISDLGPEAAKADYYYIETLIDSYQESLVYAINNNDFPFLAGLLSSDSDFYYAQKNLVEEQYKEAIKLEIYDYDIKKIEVGERDRNLLFCWGYTTTL